LVHESWLPALARYDDVLADIGQFLRAESAEGRAWAPGGGRILRAFEQPLDEVRVLIVGQDPYPTPGHAVGLSFSVAPEVRPLPRSLTNIFTELVSDLDCAKPTSGDLTPWSEQGVLLLNRVLTVRCGEPGSHRGIGWESITAAAIRALVDRDDAPLVAILWGKDAQALEADLPDVPVITSAHPSPMSADRGFFGSRPFSQPNELLDELGGDPVEWVLP
ncbi:MAG: uracil-DNA glycosylase, partial [Candidatus Nanopelagicales bacterium]|nr:uracil-DNA glycosylase [Candidatus Nanopelagicales bacterium]